METIGTEGSYRTPSFEHARVGDAMHPGIVACTPDTPLRMVAQIMAERHIHAVIVTDLEPEETKRDWGVITDVDLLGATSGDLDAETAGGFVATELPTVTTEEALPRAAQIMAEHGVTHLVVIDEARDRAVGVLSSLDIAGVVAWGRA